MKYSLRSERPASPLLDLENGLNPVQKEVVLHGGGPVLVLAGAGSGKTRTLTYRAAYLLERGLNPERLLLCTFTNRAAREMLQRVESLSGVDTKQLWAGTFHHVANRGLRQHAARLGLDPDYSILDSEDARDLMASCLGEVGSALKQKHFPQAKVVLHVASMCINRRLSLYDALRSEAPRFLPLCDELAPVIARYGERKLRLGLVDYDDLLTHFHTLLLEHPEAAAGLKERFEQVLVDEYQDTNKLQGEIVELCAEMHRNITVVGDDAQSIYAFRGAHFANIIDFPKRHPDATVYRLELNYRSTPEILAFANRSIGHNQRQFPKTLQPTRESGPLPVLLPLLDCYQQAEFVSQRVLELHQQEEIPLRRMAVLYRTHAQSVELQVELSRRNIPYKVRSGVRFFEQAHIKDVLSYLRLVQNPMDPLAWQRVLRTWSGVGKRSAEHLLAALVARPSTTAFATPHAVLMSPEASAALPPRAQTALKRLAGIFAELSVQTPLGKIILKVLDGHYKDYAISAFPNGETRIEDLVQLADYAGRYESLERFLSELALVSGVSAEAIGPGKRGEDCLTLSTVHQAKGLEWRAVFLLSLSEGNFPQALAVRTRESEEEERRLFYVAVTRAADQLYLCHPRFVEGEAGDRRLQRLSRFVDELRQGEVYPYEKWDIVTT